MADLGRMSVEEVENAINNFEARRHEFEDVTNVIGSTMFDLTGTWTGAAEQAFEGQARQLLNNLKTIMNSMEGAKGKLQTAIAAYEATEEAQSGSINAVNSTPVSYNVEG